MKKILLLVYGLFFCLNLSAQENLETGLKYYEWREYKTALPYLQAAAKEGYGEACYLLGEMYYYGYGTDKNYTIAMRMYQRGIEYGFTKGEAELGRMYENGEGAAKDLQKAFELYEKSAAKDIVLGKYLLARCYFYGEGTAQDMNKAYALLCDLNGNRNADKWILHNVYMLLGSCYEFGWGTEAKAWQAIQNYEKSENPNCLYRAASLMDAQNMGLYGEDRSSGLNLKYNRLYFLEKAIDAGLEDAQAYYLFVAWAEEENYIKRRSSDPVRRNTYSYGKVALPKVFDSLCRSAEMGYGPAQKLLGDWYKEGKGTPVNLVKSREWYAKAKANGEEVPE